MIGKIAAIVGVLVLVTIVCAFSAGWLLARPVQRRIGKPAADLNAEPVAFGSDSGATVRGWCCAIQNAKAAVLLLPGIRANRLSMVSRAISEPRRLFSLIDRLSSNR